MGLHRLHDRRRGARGRPPPTSLDVSLWSSSATAKPLLISTLPPQHQEELSNASARASRPTPTVQRAGDPRHRRVRNRAATARDGGQVEDQQSPRSVDRRSTPPLRNLELKIFGLRAGARCRARRRDLSRRISSPLQRLAEGAQRIERGDYETPSESRGTTRRASSRRRSTACGTASASAKTAPSSGRRTTADRPAEPRCPRPPRPGDCGGETPERARRHGDDGHRPVQGNQRHARARLRRRPARRIRPQGCARRFGRATRLRGWEATSSPSRSRPSASTTPSDVAQRRPRARAPFALGGVSIDVRASMGIALYPLHAEDAGTLLKRADIAMYDAKRNHQPFAVYERGRDEHSLRRLSILSELRHAIASGQLEIHYQPKIDIVSEHAVHVEALVRWRHPVHGMMPPDDFILLAEQSGSIGLITKWVLRKALSDCAGMEPLRARSDRRDQYFRARPVRRRASDVHQRPAPRWRPRSVEARPGDHRERDHEGRQLCAARPPRLEIARHRDRDRRLRHRLLLARAA